MWTVYWKFLLVLHSSVYSNSQVKLIELKQTSSNFNSNLAVPWRQDWDTIFSCHGYLVSMRILRRMLVSRSPANLMCPRLFCVCTSVKAEGKLNWKAALTFDETVRAAGPRLDFPCVIVLQSTVGMHVILI